jgi:hypothetical protein
MPIPLIAGAVLQGLGAVGNIIGAVGQKAEAQRQFDRQTEFGKQQKSAFTKGYGDLINQAQGLKTYQGDISKYVKAEQAAELGKRMAGGGRVAGEDIMRQQASQSTANTLAFAQRAGGSSSDLLTAALMGQQQEGAQMQNIDIASQQQRQQMGQQAQQNYLQSLGQTAAAQAQQAGLQFESESGKQQQLLGLAQGQFQGGMALDQSLFEQQQAAAGAVQNAKSAIWSGIGGVASTIGGGLTEMRNQQDNLAMLGQIYGGNSNAAYQSGTVQERMGNISNVIGVPKIGAATPLSIMPSSQNVPQAGIFQNINALRGLTPLSQYVNDRSQLGNYR